MPRNPTVHSATVPDWSRERPRGLWDPGRRLLGAIRGYQAARDRSGPFWALLRRWRVLEHAFWSVVTQCEIPLETEIGGGLLLTHPNGIVIHPKVRIGPNCLIFHQVTIGTQDGQFPVIEGHVDIGAGAKVIGGITVGRHAVIGVNAVVLRDVPPGGVAVGVPARIVRIMDISGESEGSTAQMSTPGAGSAAGGSTGAPRPTGGQETLAAEGYAPDGAGAQVNR